MSDLSNQRCLPCEAGVRPIEKAEALTKMSQVEGWELNEPGTEISRTFKFKNFYETMAFVNALAWIAHTEDHHPDLEVGYGSCHVRYSTHAIKGLSANDFICAAKINLLLPN
ncbi:MAG: 4a-hydroxytetrahydrobiopterin dehydratase [Gammaproteobacteria bacterium]|nr:4a-hydroxytetrahydrobiopterin dehydratase [Gammaproteobacteria bacterium]